MPLVLSSGFAQGGKLTLEMAKYSKCIKVLPTGWQSSPENETFELSDMDHTMPKIYVQIAEVFELSDDSQTHKDKILSNTMKGLEFTLSQFPILTGNFRIDDKDGRMWVTRKRDSGVDLYINELEEITYNELLDDHFPAASLAGILPKSVTEKQLFSPLGHNADEGIFMATFQISFIPGGLILAVAMHHSCSDGPGCDGFLTTWAQSSMAVANGTPFRPIDKTASDRSRLSAPSKPDPARWKEINDSLEKTHPVFFDAGAPPPVAPPDFVMPELSITMWRFSQNTTEKLKTEANTSLIQEGSFVSTYNVVMATLWKHITKSKIPLLNPSLDQEVVLCHAVNTRNKLDPPLSQDYLGNAVAMPRTHPITIFSLMSSSILELALKVRESINTITPAYLSTFPLWISGLPDRRNISYRLHAFLGMDLAATSWQSMRSYTDHDFGFGLPKAVRFPRPEFEGYVFVYPRSGEGEGTEVCVCLEKGCMERLKGDEEFGKWAQVSK